MEAHQHTILFVCTGNYYRSRYAEYLLNATLPPHLNWRADSRGFEPSPLNPGPISVDTVQRLHERGITPQSFREPIQLTEADLEQADLVIMLDEHEHRPYMQQVFPAWEERVVYWHVADLLWGFTPDQALSMIDVEVEQLIAGLVR